MSGLSVLFPRIVVVHARTRAPMPPRAALPEVGLRWGQRSRFEFGGATPEPERRQGVRIRQVDRERLVHGTESHREYETHEVDLHGVPLEVEGIKSVTFFLGEREVTHEPRTVRGGVTTIEPVIETIEEYMRFDFSTVVSGARGEPHPPATEPFRLGGFELGNFELEDRVR